MSPITELSSIYGVRLLNPMEIVKMNFIEDTSKLPIVIYHGNCADGFSAAWCFSHYANLLRAGKYLEDVDKLPPAIEAARHGPIFTYHAGVYQNPPPDVTGRVVYLVDFSYRKEVVKEMCAVAEKVWLIDHHKTALEDLAPLYTSIGGPEKIANLGVYVDLRRSGAMLAWDFLFNDGDIGKEIEPSAPGYQRPPILLEHVQDRDLWRFKLEGTREIQAAMFSRDYTFENWNTMMLGGLSEKMNLWKEGVAIERKHFKDIDELLKVAKRTMFIGGYEVPVCNLPYTLASDAGSKMCLLPDGSRDFTVPFSACYFDTATHRVFSLRSVNTGMDVSQIAQTYGGGGHPTASGFRVSREHILAMT